MKIDFRSVCLCDGMLDSMFSISNSFLDGIGLTAYSQGCNERAQNGARSFALPKKWERERERAPMGKKERERKRSLENFALQFALFLQLCAIF